VVVERHGADGIARSPLASTRQGPRFGLASLFRDLSKLCFELREVISRVRGGSRGSREKPLVSREAVRNLKDRPRGLIKSSRDSKESLRYSFGRCRSAREGSRRVRDGSRDSIKSSRSSGDVLSDSIKSPRGLIKSPRTLPFEL
jgi:hypothetical protein